MRDVQGEYRVECRWSTDQRGWQPVSPLAIPIGDPDRIVVMDFLRRRWLGWEFRLVPPAALSLLDKTVISV